MSGEITSSDTSSFIVSSFVTFAGGKSRINKLELKSGVITNSPHSDIVVKQLEWSEGIIKGNGVINIGDYSFNNGIFSLFDPSGSKLLQVINLFVFGSGVISSSCVLQLQQQAELHVHTGTFRLQPQAQIISDPSPTKLMFHEASTCIVSTGSRPVSSSQRLQSIIQVPTIAKGNVTCIGTGECVWRRDTNMETIAAQDLAGIRLQGLSSNTSYRIFGSVSLPARGQYLLLQSAVVDFVSSSLSSIHALALLDASLSMSNGIIVHDMRVGSATQSGNIEGKSLEVENMKFSAGTIKLQELTVKQGLVIDYAAGKWLNIDNLILLGGSISNLSSSLTHVSDSCLVHLLPNASLSFLSSSHLTASGPAHMHTGRPALYNQGIIRFEGRKSLSASSTLDIINAGQIQINTNNRDMDKEYEEDITHNDSVFTAFIMGGLTSLPNSTLSVLPDSVIAAICPLNYTSFDGRCSYGIVKGEGTINIQGGQHSFQSFINISHIIQQQGDSELFAQSVTQQLEIIDGKFTSHYNIFTDELLIKGGQLLGYPVLVGQ